MLEIIYANGTSEKQFFEECKKRIGETNSSVISIVNDIIENVKENKDKALLQYTEQFDKVKLSSFEVSKEEIDKAASSCDKDFLDALMLAAKNIYEFHEKQKAEGFTVEKEGIKLGQIVKGLDRVGIYVPGGTAAYPSSVLMNAIPAKVAGVNEIIMVTPPSKDGKINKNILTAAKIAGVDRVFAVGGAQAVAALAYGTESIPKVDKITGPGNIFVATAKKQLFGVVDIDMIAGPSEILIIADSTANPVFVAADLLSQAEHDTLASAILLTTSEKLAKEVLNEVNKQLKVLKRYEIAKSSIDNFGAIIVCNTLKDAFNISNKFAPEHLELMIENAEKELSNVKNAGSVFLGMYSPEPLGDYFAGPNHVLPTSGSARFFSPLSVDSFVKKTQIISYSKEAFKLVASNIETLANTEGLDAHANSVKVRNYE